MDGSAEITFTVMERNFEGKDIVRGQTQLSLNKDNIWLNGGRFSIDLHQELKHKLWDNRAQESEFDYEQMAEAGTVTVEVDELWSKHSVCGQVEGPHLDILCGLGKKVGAQTMSIAKMSQKMPYWVVITNGCFHVYRHFGDPVARAVCPLEKMSVTRGKLTGRSGKDLQGDTQRRKSGGTLRRTSMADTSHLREFVLRTDDLSSRNRQKYVFECHTVKDCNLFIEMLEYWMNANE